MIEKIKKYIQKDKDLSEDSIRDEVAEIDDGDIELVIQNEEKINKKLSSASPFAKYIEVAKVMLLMLKDYRKGDYKAVPWFTIASIAMGLLYVLNPFDLIPDFIPGVGYIDDLTVFAFAMNWVESDLHKYIAWKTPS